MSFATDALFKPFELKSLKLKSRVVMAPMTRSFSPGNVPNEKNVAYYRRRAAGGVGLIVTEGTEIDHPGASGFPNVPHIFGEQAMAAGAKWLKRCMLKAGRLFRSCGMLVAYANRSLPMMLRLTARPVYSVQASPMALP